MIKVKGNQVAPAELEGLLLEHPAISDAAVVGVTMLVTVQTSHLFLTTKYCTSLIHKPLRSGEEVPRAYVVLQEGDQQPTPRDIANWLAERVSRHKRVTGGVVIYKEIPKNPSGKILRKILRDRAKEEVGDREEKRESRL